MGEKVLVTGGTVFVSRYVAEYYVRKGADVYVLNRGNKPQSEGVILIQADRHALGDVLREHHFDVILDVSKQERLMPETKALDIGLKEALAWYVNNCEQVNRKNYFEYIDNHLA